MPQYNIVYREKNGKPKRLPVFSPSVGDAERDAGPNLPKKAIIMGVEATGGEATKTIQQF